MSVTYRYLLCDLLTDVEICDLELENVSYDHRINQAGTLSGQIQIANTRLSDRLDRVLPRDTTDLSTGVGRVICHVYRDEDLWGSYWLWQGKVSQSRGNRPAAEIRGMSLDGYMGSVEIQSDLSWAATDQVEIVRQLIAHMQADSRCNIGLIMQAGTSGITQDLTILASDKARYGPKISEIASSSSGFEYRINTRLSSGQRIREFVWAYPKLGQVSTRHDFSMPGSVLEWSEEVDAQRGATRWTARGDSVNDDLTATSKPLASTVHEATSFLAAGWPRIDRTIDYPGVRDSTILEGYAGYWAAIAPGAVRIHTATVELGDNPTLTPANLGDYAAFRLTNERYPLVDGVASFVKSWRVVGMEIKPPSRGGDIEECTLIFEEVTGA